MLILLGLFFAKIVVSDDPSPPILPVRYYTEFSIFYTSLDSMEPPPWPGIIPPTVPFVAGRGATWYASDLGIAIERYEDFCVPVFNPLPYFPCLIFNYNHRAYLISPEYTIYGPCCIYQEDWEIPKRDFMKAFAKDFNGTTVGFGEAPLDQEMNWWNIYDGNKTFGGYGWAGNVPVDFWYVGEVGWAHQIFANFTDRGQEVDRIDQFTLPKVCENVQINCIDKIH